MSSVEAKKAQYKNEITTARHAAGWNMGMAATQAVIGAATGNIGFINEAGHNIADAGAFYADGEALTRTPKITKRYRRAAATILSVAGIAGLAGGGYQLATGEKENSSSVAIGLAAAGAIVNFGVARKTHGARHGHDHSHSHDHDHSAHSHGHHFDAHSDNALHAVTDAVTGFIYTAGLALEHKVPGAASWAIVVNGGISTASAIKTHQMISVSTAPEVHDH